MRSETGQIARAAAIFQIDEVVVFNDSSPSALKDPKWNPNVFLARILQYLETPQYLRKALFPMHPDLKYAGLLNPLDTPHHMRIDEPAKFREAVVLKRPIKVGKGSFVNAGTCVHCNDTCAVAERRKFASVRVTRATVTAM